MKVRCHFVEFGPDNDTQELAFKNYGKKKVNISFDLTMVSVPLKLVQTKTNNISFFFKAKAGLAWKL